VFVSECAVSSEDQRSDLDRQVSRLTEWATGNGLEVGQVVCEVGSGLNGKRPKLARILSDPSATVIAVEHRDRLARFGVEHLQAAVAAQGRRIVIADDGETADDLVRDRIEVLTSMCARLYGRRGGHVVHPLRLDAAPRPGRALAGPMVGVDCPLLVVAGDLDTAGLGFLGDWDDQPHPALVDGARRLRIDLCYRMVRWCAGCVEASVLRTWFVVVGPTICGYEADDE
jgi:putative resolvase